MTYAAGALTLVSVTAQTAVLSSAAASGGTGPYTYQWYRSTTSGFTPGAGNIITGATSLTLNDSGLIPNTTYYYEVVATDTGNANATADSAQLSVATTQMTLSQNTLAQNMVAGLVDQRFANNTMPVMIDASQTGTAYPGQAVKIVDSADGVPKVVTCSANADDVAGFLNYDGKVTGWTAGQQAEMSGLGNCIYLWTTTAVSRGTQVQLDVSSPASVAAKVGASGAAVVGWAYDKATAGGSLVRIKLEPDGVLGKTKA